MQTANMNPAIPDLYWISNHRKVAEFKVAVEFKIKNKKQSHARCDLCKVCWVEDSPSSLQATFWVTEKQNFQVVLVFAW